MKSLAKVKRVVSKFIRENPNASYQEWVDFQKNVPEIRIRRVTDSITQINLEGNASFIDPSSWLNNYIAGQKIKLRESLSTADKVLQPEEIVEVIMGLDDNSNFKGIGMDATKWTRVYSKLYEVISENSDKNFVPACNVANFICWSLYHHPFRDEEGLRKLFEEST